ncbi:MAG: hypothetical protein ACUVTD_04965 [Nitrososphaerales archaeon]
MFKACLEGSQTSEKRILLSKGVVLDSTDKTFASKLSLNLRYYDTPLIDLMVADGRDVMIGVPDPLSDEHFHAIAIWVRNISFGRSIQKSLKDLWNKSSEP